MAKEFYIRKSDGLYSNSKEWKKYCDSLPDGKYKITIESAKKRSLQQNKYYWKVVIQMVQDGFYEKGTEVGKDDVHDFLKGRFNFKEVVNETTGEVIQVPFSTTELFTVGFISYIEKIQRFAAEWFGINIPDPNEQMELVYE